MERITLGLDILKEMEQQVTRIKLNMKVAQDRNKRCADRNMNPREFKVGGHVYL
jgi:hypothetical protein